MEEWEQSTVLELTGRPVLPSTSSSSRCSTNTRLKHNGSCRQLTCSLTTWCTARARRTLQLPLPCFAPLSGRSFSFALPSTVLETWELYRPFLAINCFGNYLTCGFRLIERAAEENPTLREVADNLWWRTIIRIWIRRQKTNHKMFELTGIKTFFWPQISSQCFLNFLSNTSAAAAAVLMISRLITFTTHQCNSLDGSTFSATFLPQCFLNF